MVWLASFEALWKFLDDDMAEGLARAVRRGVGFIHSGGMFSFHGGNGRGACLDFFPALAEMLPVEVRRGKVDLHMMNTSHDVRVLARGWNDAGLKALGVRDFNEVSAKARSQVIMKFQDWPLLVVSQYGRGRTAAFMGFTPGEMPVAGPPAKHPLSPTWLALYGQLLLHVLGENPDNRYALVAGEEKPLFQLLKEQPAATVTVAPSSLAADVRDGTAQLQVELRNGPRFARLLRVRAEWDDADHGYMVPAEPYSVLFSDNYFDLFPGERKMVTLDLRLPGKLPRPLTGQLVVEGTNVPAMKIPVRLTESP